MKKNILDNEKYYQKIKSLNQKHYAGEISYYSKALIRRVEEKILSNLKNGSKILDLGCGSGRFSIGAAKLGFNVCGLDITQEAIDASIKRAHEEHLDNVEFFCGDMTTIPFNDDEFDFVFCPRFSINAVATLEKRKQAVKEMLRVVKNGGIVHIESFNKLYLGKGILFLLKNILRDLFRYFKVLVCKLFNKNYVGLLPGDIVYEANKVKGASIGYAHLPTFIELKKMIPTGFKYKMYSIPQIKSGRMDIFKYFRYSIWIFIKK